MSRYSKYFLQHTLWLDDGFCSYYVQDPHWCWQDVLDVPCVIFDSTQEAEDWLWQCIDENWDTALRRLRSFLAEESFVPYQVHRMDDRQVVKAVAHELCRQVHKVVIEPRPGWAVTMNAATNEPELPIAVEPASRLQVIFPQIQQELNALVAAQQKKYDQIEAMLAKMSAAERAAAYAKAAGKGLVVDPVEDMVDFCKNLPSLYWSLLKKEWRIITFPARLGMSTGQSIALHSMTPLDKELSPVIRQFTQTAQEAEKLANTMYILLVDDDSFAMLTNFARRYWHATHPLEKARIGASLLSNIVLTIILALISAGIGELANIIAKSELLERIAAKLEELAMLVKRIGRRHKLPKIGHEIETAAADSEKVAERIERAGGRGMPEIEAPERRTDIIDDLGRKGYGEDGDLNGPKTPKGFSSADDFAQFGQNLKSGLKIAGFDDVQPFFQGSSVTGKSFRTGKPFDVGRVSDFDVALSSPKMLQKAKELGIPLRSQGVRTCPLKPVHLEKLGLTDIASQLSNEAGRPVNFMIFDSAATATAKAPSILVP
jgi:hypothetical protein